MKHRGKKGRDDVPRSRVNITEARQELEASKKSVQELLRMRLAIFRGKEGSAKEIEALREKAIDAINQLFDDEVDSAG
jgi:hypothetical protein